MSSPPPSLLLISLVAMVGACTNKPCHEDQLRAAANALEDRSIAGREAGLAALRHACPAMPSVLANRLDLGFGHSGGRTIPFVDSDPVYDRLHNTTCPTSSDAWSAVLARWDVDEAVFAACDLDRYGLRGAEEPFMVEDLTGYILYEWLTAGRIDDELARQVVRGLISANASDEELAQNCRLQDRGCGVLVSRAGVSLPRSTASDYPAFEHATHLWLTKNEAQVNGQRVDMSADASQGSLARALANAADSYRDIAAEDPLGPSQPTIVLAADGALEFATIATALFTATRSGHGVFELAVADDHSIQMIRAQPPSIWRPPQPRDSRDDPQVHVFIHLDNVEIADGQTGDRMGIKAVGDCSTAPSGCLDSAAIRAALARKKQAAPDQSAIDVHVDGGVRYQTLITVLDLARGECGLNPGEGAEVPDTCVFWRPTLNLDPPLYWNMGARLTLGTASASRFEAHSQVVELSNSKQLAAFEAARAQVLDCLTNDVNFIPRLADDDAALQVMWGPSPANGQIVAGVWTGFSGGPWADPELEACILPLFDATPAAPERRSWLVTQPHLELKIPLELHPSE